MNSLNRTSTRKYISGEFHMGQLEEIKEIGATAGREDRKRRRINKLIAISLKTFNALCIPISFIGFAYIMMKADFFCSIFVGVCSAIINSAGSSFLFSLIEISELVQAFKLIIVFGYLLLCLIIYLLFIVLLFSLSDLIKASLNYYDKTGRFYKRNKGKEVVWLSFGFLLNCIFVPRERKNHYKEGGLVK